MRDSSYNIKETLVLVFQKSWNTLALVENEKSWNTLAIVGN